VVHCYLPEHYETSNQFTSLKINHCSIQNGRRLSNLLRWLETKLDRNHDRAPTVLFCVTWKNANKLGLAVLLASLGNATACVRHVIVDSFWLDSGAIMLLHNYQ
jgi:hypothetical protein